MSINLNSKAQQLRDRVEDVLQRRHLMIVFDEAHYLWPQGNYRQALPARINWIITALVNCDVPVALITTPQFMKAQKIIENRTWWASEQLTGRVFEYVDLPERLSEEDLRAVANSLLSTEDQKSIDLLVSYAQASAKYLAGIESAVSRAR